MLPEFTPYQDLKQSPVWSSAAEEEEHHQHLQQWLEWHYLYPEERGRQENENYISLRKKGEKCKTYTVSELKELVGL